MKRQPFIAPLILLLALLSTYLAKTLLPFPVALYPSDPPLPTLVKPSPVSRAGNLRFHSFREAKKAARTIYRGMEVTFYCGCSFHGLLVDHRSCGYVPQREEERTYLLEWEHVVPAAAFGSQMQAWREGHPRCRSKDGRDFRGRKCARQVSAQFRQMESDLYNLVPEIGEMNMYRSDLPFTAELHGSRMLMGRCETKIGRAAVEPRSEIRGFIARTYRYMEAAYPGFHLIDQEREKLFTEWDASYPPTSLELERARRIAAMQGNRNPYIRTGF